MKILNFKDNYIKLLLIASLFVHILVYLDFYWFPLSKKSEIVTRVTSVTHRTIRTRFTTFNFETGIRKYRVYEDCFQKVNKDDTVTIHRTFILNSIKQVSVIDNQEVKIFMIDFFSVTSLLSLLIVFSLLGIFLFLFSSILTMPSIAKNNLVIVLFVFTLIFVAILLFY